MTFGALGAGSQTAMVPNLLAAAGAPIRVVLGYVSTARILLALEQGEVDGSFTTGNGLASRPALAEAGGADRAVGGALSGPAAAARRDPRRASSRCSIW